MYLVQDTANAHFHVPEYCWRDVSTHRVLRQAVASARRELIDTGGTGRANNVQILRDGELLSDAEEREAHLMAECERCQCKLPASRIARDQLCAECSR